MAPLKSLIIIIIIVITLSSVENVKTLLGRVKLLKL